MSLKACISASGIPYGVWEYSCQQRHDHTDHRHMVWAQYVCAHGLQGFQLWGMPCHTDDTHGTWHHHGYSCDMLGFRTESMIYHICHTYKAGCQDVISYVLPVCWHHCKHKRYLWLSNTVTLSITRTVMYLVRFGVLTAVSYNLSLEGQKQNGTVQQHAVLMRLLGGGGGPKILDVVNNDYMYHRFQLKYLSMQKSTVMVNWKIVGSSSN